MPPNQRDIPLCLHIDENLNIANHWIASQADDAQDCNECNRCAGSSPVHLEFNASKSGAARLLVPFYGAEIDFDDVCRGQDKRD